MSRFSKDILYKTQLSTLRSLAHTIFCLAILMMVAKSPVADYLNTKLVWPLDFHLRERLGLGKKLNPKIKVFTVDDSTVSWLKRPNLALEEWYKILAAVHKSKPSLILIDKIFGLEDAPLGAEAANARAESQLIRLQAPIVVGSFATNQTIKFRPPLKLSGDLYSLDRLRNPNFKQTFFTSMIPDVDIPKIPNAKVYGPYADIRPAFKGIGHIQYQSNHKIAPFFQLDENTVLPHFALFASNDIKFNGLNLLVNNSSVPTLDDGSVLVNFISKNELLSSAKSLRPELELAFANKSIPRVRQGDIVVILPMFYTGNADFKDTPLGYMPGSLPHVSFLNSVLSNDWLYPVHPSLLLLALCCVLGALLARQFDNKWLLLVTSVSVLSFFVVSQYLFSFHGISLPWLLMSTAFASTAMCGFFYKSRINAHKETILRMTLDGAVSPKDLDHLVSGGRKINLDAKEHVVTIMFIDVVGYSLMSENQIPRVAFDQLKTLLSRITDEVHSYGGMVNKTLGDGLLCIFGYNFENDMISTDHAEKSVACAISIQEKNLRRNLEADSRNEPVYPLRIGVHTSSVFLGDLGSGSRIDFTAVGNGVNFAKRLEQACDMHSVLYSGTTRDLIASLGLHMEGIQRRMISIKHHSNQIEAFEFNPFFRAEELRLKALDAYRKCASLARLEQRYVFIHQDLIQLNSSVGDAKLINYSATGISIKLRSHLVKGSTVLIRIDSRDGQIGQMMSAIGITEIKAEVRWAYNESDGTVHGLLYRNLSEGAAHQMVDLLKKYDISMRMSKPISKIG